MYEGAINNRLPADLSAAAPSVLRPRLPVVELRAGAQLQDFGPVLTNVYFPTTATVSLTIGLADSAMAEVAPIGNASVVGVCAFRGGPRSATRSCEAPALRCGCRTAPSAASRSFESRNFIARQ
jgi:hypothetical protein